MGVSTRLDFDPTDADSIAASHNVGAFVRAGTDGDLIGSETLNSLEWLRVTGPIIDSSGNEVTVTGGALNVNIASAPGDGSDDLANVAIENTARSLSTTAIDVVTSALSARKWLYVANEGNKSMYFGKTGVTTANGWPMHRGERLEARIGAAVTPQIIGGAGSSGEDIRVMELS